MRNWDTTDWPIRFADRFIRPPSQTVTPDALKSMLSVFSSNVRDGGRPVNSLVVAVCHGRQVWNLAELPARAALTAELKKRGKL